MFGLFKPKDRVAVLDSGESLTVKGGQDLLSAALMAGLKWQHDCRQGNCSKCRCILRKGKIKPKTDFANALTPDELAQGTILACQSLLKSDIEVSVELDTADQRIAPQKITGTITETNALTHDIMEVVVRCDTPPPAGILAGQYAEVSYEGLPKPRSYSFARSPEREHDCVRFFIRKVPKGTFTEWLFAGNRVGTPLTLTLPFGDFYMREGDETMLCMAGGSGMSALKALLEKACDAKVRRNVLFLFGARAQPDLYCADDMRALAESWTDGYKFEYVEVLSEEPEDSGWQGPRGYVTDHLVANYSSTGKIDIKKCQAYMCGPPPMIDAFIDILHREGLDDSKIFYDKFLDASTSPDKR